MTIDDFLARLKDTSAKFVKSDPDFRFEIGEFDAETIRIIIDGRGVCPVCALAYDMTGKLYDSSDFIVAAKEIGLDEQAATHIADTADTASYCPDTRKRLLEACRLSPETIYG
jgi:hypothetical protein